MDKIGCKKDYYTLAVRIQRRWFGCYWSIFTFTIEFKTLIEVEYRRFILVD